MDYATLITSIKKTNRLIVVEESWPFAAISTEIAYVLQRRAFDYLDAPIIRITAAPAASTTGTTSARGTGDTSSAAKFDGTMPT